MDIKYISKILIIILVILCILLIENFFISKNKKKITESFSDVVVHNNMELIKFGNFDNKQHILNAEVGSGNVIVSYPNPGNSSYVLQQSTLLSDCEDTTIKYKIRLYLNNNKFYRLTAWVCITQDWNGNNFIFCLRLYNKTNSTFKKSEGRLIDTQKIYNVSWHLYEYILQLNSDDTGEVYWYLGYEPNNTQGNRYITGISVMLFNPLLKDFRVCLGLQCFLNTNNE